MCLTDIRLHVPQATPTLYG